MSNDEQPDPLTELANKVDTLHRRIKVLEEERDDDKRRIAVLEQENSGLKGELATLRDRTDLFDRVQRAAALKPEERAAVLIQTLYSEAESSDGRATMDAGKAVGALGGGVNRTLMYGENGAFQRAVDLVGNEDVLWYKEESRSSQKNSRLILDLNAGKLPQTVNGHELKKEAVNAD